MNEFSRISLRLTLADQSASESVTVRAHASGHDSGCNSDGLTEIID